jgi:diguanylate cyclase (GGDEF)-like protein/PAS domain S-box-containing protein
MQRARQLRRTFLFALLLFVGGMLGVTAYTLWRLRADSIASGLEIAAMHSRGLEDFLTQSLNITELALANAVTQEAGARDLRLTEANFVTTLRHSPFLRSISLLDERQRIVASSNPGNIGVTVSTQDYFPPAAASREILRIGQPWAGRDFADGRPASAQAPVASDEASFIPVARALKIIPGIPVPPFSGAIAPSPPAPLPRRERGALPHSATGMHNPGVRVRLDERKLTLLVALNPDYFINHVSQQLAAEQGSVEILRYDGTLLMATASSKSPGTLRAFIARDLRLAEVESGEFEEDAGVARPELTAFRASRLFPLVVVTRMDREYALRHWLTEARTLLAVVLPALLVITLLALVFYRRQMQLTAQRVESERLQRINATVFDSSAEATLITDLDAKIVSVNTAFTEVTGYPAAELVGRPLCDLLTAEGAADLSEKMPRRQETEGSAMATESLAIEVQQRCKDGSLIWMEVLSTPERDGQGRIAGYHRIGRNITARKQAEEKLRLAASVFTHAREGIMITAVDGSIIDVNDTFCTLTGYSRGDVLGKNPRLLQSELQPREFYAAMWRNLNGRGYWSGEIWNRRKNGELYAALLTIGVVSDAQGKARQYVALFSDITAVKQHEVKLERIAHYDALTGLPNRVLLSDRLHQSMVQAQRRGKGMAVAFLDLDGFKAINDRHGHDVGDGLLIAVASGMKQTLREGDTLARLGGDEFIAVLIDLPNVAASEPLLTRLLAAAAEPVSVNERLLQVSASLGVTFYPQAGDVDADQLLRQADQAMYQAKLAGKNRYQIFAA